LADHRCGDTEKNLPMERRAVKAGQKTPAKISGISVNSTQISGISQLHP